MSKYDVKFQVDNGLWYQGGKLEFLQDKLVLSFFVRIKEQTEYSKIISVENTRYLYFHSFNVIENGRQTNIIPSLFSYRKLLDDFRINGIAID